VNVEEASVSRAVVPPSPIIHAVTMANIWENALTARFSGEERPIMSTETVWRLFWRVYARITGVELFSNSQNSERKTPLEVSSVPSPAFGSWSASLGSNEVYSSGTEPLESVMLPVSVGGKLSHMNIDGQTETLFSKDMDFYFCMY
jgi:hypothetical protein